MNSRVIDSLFLLLGLVVVDMTGASELLRRQYSKADASFCNSQVCVDFDGDGQRELLFASRKTKKLEMLRAIDGKVMWSKGFEGDQQSLSAFDLDGDGQVEILYGVSGPGRLYVIDTAGEVLRQWDSEDWKLGNSPVIVDVDGDGRLDGLLGTRSRSLIRLKMADLSLVERREQWQQCGGHTTAMDVDGDGRWDCFAGTGDDGQAKGFLHRYDPVTLKTVWSFATNDNASSADAVLVDIDGDGQVEILKSVDNYARDEAHDALYALETDGTKLWEVTGICEEDSPNAADLDGDGEVEIVGMTFGGEVYCLDSRGEFKWRKDLRPELDDHDAHAYLTPILCDVNGDRQLEIVAMTNGGYFDEEGKPAAGQKMGNGIVYVLSPEGVVLDKLDVGGPRYWGDGFVCNVDEDPFLELVITGSGGLDVIETRGYGPNIENFQRRRTYQRLNVLPWAYEDSYFIRRGNKEGVVNRTDNLVLVEEGGFYRKQGKFTTEILTLPPQGYFCRMHYETRTPVGTSAKVNLLNGAGEIVQTGVASGEELLIREPIRIEFLLATEDRERSPVLDSYRLSFDRE